MKLYFKIIIILFASALAAYGSDQPSKKKHIILFIGDGMPYPLSFSDSQFDYFISKGEATDSAAAGTAISTGRKTDRGNIAWMEGDPEDGALPIISEKL
ncbi:MAG: hypothetical protein JW864_01490 [Spirochaetes bacterium]|nr:hypothetical protein [Spirochaetota bacterium]